MPDTYKIKDTPELLEIEPTRGCNLRCIMCHVPHEKSKPQYIDLEALRKSTEGIRDCHVIIGSEYEPTIHPQFEKLLRLAINRNWKVDFLTNGVKLHKIDNNILADVNFHVFNVSFDGATEQTFSKVRMGGDYNKVLDNISNASEIVRNNGACTAINSTLLGSNLHETEDSVQMWDRLGFDLIRLLVMQVRHPGIHILKESLYFKREELIATLNGVSRIISEKQLRIGVRNGYFGSPNFRPPKDLNVKQSTIYSNNSEYCHVPGVRQDMQLGDWPGMQWPCKSPYVYCRVRWDGSIDLCNNRNYVIGNIKDRSVIECWHGSEAKQIRVYIQSVPGVCQCCDYYRFCIASRNQNYNEKEDYFASGLLQHPIVFSLKLLCLKIYGTCSSH